MGTFSVEIELINGADIALSKKQMIGEEEIKSIRVAALVDTGTLNLCINENIQSYLQCQEMGRKPFEMADGSVVEYTMVGPVEVDYNGHRTTCRAVVLPGNAEPLLGAIPMEGMEVVIDPSGLQLVYHPYELSFSRPSYKRSKYPPTS